MAGGEYHGCVEEGIVECWVCFKELTPEEGGVCDILVEGDEDWVGGVVGEGEDSGLSHFDGLLLQASSPGWVFVPELLFRE